MTDEHQATATSFTSFEEAAADALRQFPAGPEGLRSAAVQRQTVMEGGFVGRMQFTVTLVRTTPGEPESREEPTR